MRRALVVGAAQGIGRATAQHLAERGDAVVATWNSTEPAPDEGVRWARCDITDPTAVDALFADHADAPFEIVVINAAVVRDRMSSRMADRDFTDVLDVNLTGAFRVARAAVAPMASARWGRLVIVSSVGGWYGNAGQANYAASKAGQLGMARALAREVGPRGVTVNVLAPGAIRTELIESMSPTLQARWKALLPADRMGTPDEVAAAVSYLTSERAGFVTGALLPVDGGCLA